jgi:Tol biopolymer transport system component
VALALPAQAGFAAGTPTTIQVSVTSTGAHSAKSSWPGTLSADGRYSVIEGVGDDLVPDDSNNWNDVFLHDEVTGATTRVSRGLDGQQPNRLSVYPVISADGRWIAYESSASNIVPDDTNDSADVFLYEVGTGATTRVSVTSKGEQGKFGGGQPSISADGRYIAFESSSHLAGPGADLNGASDAFVYDRVKKTVVRASVSTAGVGVNKAVADVQISGDGRTVAFATKSSNLTGDDTHGIINVFVRDLVKKTTTLVSTSTAGVPAGGARPYLDHTGRHVVFDSNAGNLVPGDTPDTATHAYLFDLVSGERTKLPTGNGASWARSISADGAVVGYAAAATNIVAGDTNGVTDSFVFDKAANTVARISVSDTGAQLDKNSGGAIVSPDGRSALFQTDSTNVVPDTVPNQLNVYVRHFG